MRLPGRTISIHAPRTGSDGACRWRLDSPAHFNPRSPHGERPRFTTARCAPCSFQSTLPARGATVAALSEKSGISFQSTLPARGATNWDDINKAYSEYISIHAPRTGSDQRQMADVPQLPSISIHAPRTGSDDISAIAKDKYNQFQSTLPARGATDAGTKRGTSGQFQSTLPARGATMADVRDGPLYRFQSTLPARGATCAY